MSERIPQWERWTRRLWPYDDRQPVGLLDFVMTGVISSALLWPPFFGVAHWWLCMSTWPHHINARFFRLLIGFLVVTGASIGFLCSLVAVLGAYYRKRWVARLGPFLMGAALVMTAAWSYPLGFEGYEIAWRSAGTRALLSVLISLPTTWLPVRIAFALSTVHPHRDLFGDP